MLKDLEISRLADVYGSLLTENMRVAVRDYYDNDMSLSEIGEEMGISRQAVMCRLRQAENKLREYESTLGLVRMTDKLEKDVSEIDSDLERGHSEKAHTVVNRMLKELNDGRY